MLRRVYAFGAHGIFKHEIRDCFELLGAPLPEWVPRTASQRSIQLRDLGSRALAGTWFRNQRPEYLRLGAGFGRRSAR